MRLYKYDLVRAVSIAFVVAVHCHNYIDTSIPVLALVDRAIVTLFLVGNALFFMMSGRFNIKKREGDHAVAKYYLGKVRNILIPVVLFFFIRTVFNDWGNLSFTTVIKDFIKNLTFAFYHTEYWFIYDLVGILLVAPMLSKMVLNMTRKEKTAFLAVGFAITLLPSPSLILATSFPGVISLAISFLSAPLVPLLRSISLMSGAAGSSTSPQSCRLQPRCT